MIVRNFAFKNFWYPFTQSTSSVVKVIRRPPLTYTPRERTPCPETPQVLFPMSRTLYQVGLFQVLKAYAKRKICLTP